VNYFLFDFLVDKVELSLEWRRGRKWLIAGWLFASQASPIFDSSGDMKRFGILLTFSLVDPFPKTSWNLAQLDTTSRTVSF
jgi:hypothetical protein